MALTLFPRPVAPPPVPLVVESAAPSRCAYCGQPGREEGGRFCSFDCALLFDWEFPEPVLGTRCHGLAGLEVAP